MITAYREARHANGTQLDLSYDALGWSDVVADRTSEIASRIVGFLHGRSADTPKPASAQGVHAGIRYRVEGSGRVLFLLQFFLAPSQWLPAVPALARHFTVITLGGPHLGGIAALEDQARAPTYRAMFGTLVDFIAPRPRGCDPRRRLRCRLARSTSGAVSRCRQPDHRGRRQSVPA
jgi:hypothetical protein